MNKIYTKTGDAGETSLVGGERVTKDCITLQVTGELDELNSKIGEVTAILFDNPPVEFLIKIQRDLFRVGSEVASLQMSVGGGVDKITETEAEELENMIDSFWKDLPELKSFVLPGGSLAGAHLHSARAICRRAERALVALGKEKEVRSELYKYLNRLSDYLFTAARWVNKEEGAEEVKV